MSLYPKIKSNDFIELCLLLPCCRTTLDLGIVKKSIVVDDVSNWWGSQSRFVRHMHCWPLLSPQWFTLKDTESGRLHFRLEWLSLLPSTERLEQVWETQRTFPHVQGVRTLTFCSFSPRSWRERKPLPAKSVTHHLQLSWLCIWTRRRNFLWVILLPAVPTFVLRLVLLSVCG